MTNEGSALVSELTDATVFGQIPECVTAISQDSRNVLPGAAFVAVPGGRMDGHAFLRHAAANGAALLVVQHDHHGYWQPLREGGTCLVSVPDCRQALAQLAAAYHGHPARELTMVGVTGTDGKTTTSFLTAGVLAAGGFSTALLSTAGSRIDDGPLTPNQHHLTTPDVVAVQRFLASARDAGADCVIVESTSQGLHQGRLAHAEFDVAALTNLSGDHLDYHGTREAYLSAKAQLFELLDAACAKQVEKTAVLNADDPAAEVLASRTSARRLWYGLTQRGDLGADRVEPQGWGTRYRLRAGARTGSVRLALPGQFNVHNSLAAAAVGVALGLDLDQIRHGLESVRQVPGRMERIEAGQEPTVVVDYAHTAYELSQSLSFLRGGSAGRVIAVFGCAGDRDPGRRPRMGRVAAELADYTVVTSEDAWSEDPEKIMAEIAGGLAAAGKQPDLHYAVRGDRREAIGLALAMAGSGDTVLVTGMGHEQSMMVAGHARPWDDRVVIRELLSARAPAAVAEA